MALRILQVFLEDQRQLSRVSSPITCVPLCDFAKEFAGLSSPHPKGHTPFEGGRMLGIVRNDTSFPFKKVA